jgi:hypothetical protein
MNKTTCFISFLIFSFLSCKKEDKVLVSTITLSNKTFTDVTATINGKAREIPWGDTIQVSGNPGSVITGTLVVSKLYFNNLGLGGVFPDLPFTLTTFPSSGNMNYNVNVPSSYFFLNIQNDNPSKPILQFYVNYGLQSQSLEKIRIPVGLNFPYKLGYFKAFANSNVRAENGTSFWSWPTLNLPFTENQSVTLLAK